jgi:hypothetical protein
MRREVCDAVGGLDERFGLGFFDDDDLVLRARRASFELAVARDLFLHHFGSRTFAGNAINAERLLEENAKRLAEKWRHGAARGQRVALQPWSNEPGAPAGLANGFSRRTAKPLRKAPDRETDIGSLRAKSAALSQSNRMSTDPISSFAPLRLCERSSAIPKVSLTLIVRDEESNLPRCLESVHGIFDEIIMVDTGSVDRTKAVARQCGARRRQRRRDRRRPHPAVSAPRRRPLDVVLAAKCGNCAEADRSWTQVLADCLRRPRGGREARPAPRGDARCGMI